MDGENTHQEMNKGKRLMEENKSNFRRGKPPDKRRHQMEMNHWTDLIQKKEALLKSSNVPKLRKSTSSVHGNRDELLVKLRSLRSEKEEKMKQKQVIDVEIKSLNQQVVKKNETCMKLQANVKYKDEQRTNNAIKHLERHLTTHQLKLSEEKKLVCEIDALKRSKKTLSEYLSAKQEVDQLRLRQSGLRNERDILMRETHDIKARENDVKVSLDSLKEEIKETDNEEKKPAIDRDALKKEVDSLYEKRRELHESYRQELASYHEEQKQNEKDKQQLKAEQRRDETRLTKITAERARHEKRHESKPFEEEKNICLCLIQYLEPLIAQCSVENDEVDGGNKISSRFLDVPKCEASGTEEGSFVMKRDQDDNLGGLFVQSNRRMTRKGSRKGRKSKDSAQKLVLHPHVFEQFFKLSLEPPSTYADVGGILEKLREKFRKYWCEAGSTKTSEPMPVIPENLASKDLGKKDFGLRYELPSRSPNAENQTSNEMLTEHDTEEEKHEMAKFVPEMEKVEREIVKDEQKTDDAQPETMRIEHEMEQLEHEPNQREHEVQQLEHEPEQTEHEVRQLEHEPEQDEHEPIRVAHESEREEREMIENLHGKDQHECVDDEEDIFRNERSSCTDEQIATENLLNKEGSELSCKECKEHNEVLNSSCMNCSTVITDALEKGMDSINIKETSQEIQVRVT